MSPLNNSPRLLPIALFLRISLRDANGCRVEDYISAHQGIDSSRLRKPLIIAYQNADGAVFCMENFEPVTAFFKVIFFIEERVMRDVHLSVFPDNLAALIKDNRGIVAFTTFFFK